MNTENTKNWFDEVESVVTEPLKFKAKLAIGEDAYTSLRLKNMVVEAWDAVGVAGTAVGIAKSTAVASTFFAPSGFLAVLGFGAAVTPIGWAIAAGVLTGGTWVGVTRYLKDTIPTRVTVIPDFINTPMDVLALALFDLLAPLALKIADIDGHIADSERNLINDHFVNDWGYDAKFVSEGIAYTESKLAEFSIKEIAKTLAEFRKDNPDCNYKSMSNDTLSFLQEIIESDGIVDEREEMAIERIKAIFKETGLFSFKKTAKSSWGSIKNTMDSVKPKNLWPGKKD